MTRKEETSIAPTVPTVDAIVVDFDLRDEDLEIEGDQITHIPSGAYARTSDLNRGKALLRLSLSISNKKPRF